MQYTLRVITNKTQSLRSAIINDKSGLLEYELMVSVKKRKTRGNGWSKIKNCNGSGVINVAWDSPSSTLTARCISKNGNNPNLVLSRFILYLMEKYTGSIHSMILVP